MTDIETPEAFAERCFDIIARQYPISRGAFHYLIRARDAAVRREALRPVRELAERMARDGMAEAVSVGDCYARAAMREWASAISGALADKEPSDD